MNWKSLTALAMLAAIGRAVDARVQPAHAASASLAALDPDKDGTVDLAEAKAAGAKEFAKLDPDKDGTLDAKELGGDRRLAFRGPVVHVLEDRLHRRIERQRRAGERGRDALFDEVQPCAASSP
jgi:hypothetical protein